MLPGGSCRQQSNTNPCMCGMKHDTTSSLPHLDNCSPTHLCLQTRAPSHQTPPPPGSPCSSPAATAHIVATVKRLGGLASTPYPYSATLGGNICSPSCTVAPEAGSTLGASAAAEVAHNGMEADQGADKEADKEWDARGGEAEQVEGWTEDAPGSAGWLAMQARLKACVHGDTTAGGSKHAPWGCDVSAETKP